MNIRTATPADEEHILNIWRAAVDTTHHSVSATDRQQIEDEVVTFLPHAPLWLSVDNNDAPTGFMLLDNGHMEALFIHPSQHGSGIGRALVQHARSMHLTLTTDVNEQNEQAVGFYEHMGCERTGRSDKDSQGRPYPLIHLRIRQ